MRGTRCGHQASEPEIGIIPAHAGNTLSAMAQSWKRRDHPRACGEHAFRAVRVDRATGSSPRMRGTLWRGSRESRRPGIIPAHAGNTGLTSLIIFSFRDHPRACGEHWVDRSRSATATGSSPRMRGTPLDSLTLLLSVGIIPAHAGNTECDVFD